VTNRDRRTGGAYTNEVRSRGPSTEVEPSPDETLETLATEISYRLDLSACCYEPFPFDSLLPRIEADRIVLPADEPGVRSYADWHPGLGLELPVRSGALTLGRFVLRPRDPTCGVSIPLSSRTCALAIAELAADAIVRVLTVANAAPRTERDPSWPTSSS
jgi:hypothetical protein